ncbi:MAG TPA: MFS transporter [Capillimicrobium sp.]|nr:MFS transporter [Capillimicrobium sp.]
MPAHTDRPAARPGQTRNLVLATIAFAVCFYAWSLLGPLAPDLEKQLGLSDLESSAMVAVPVLLGAVLRVPLGLLTDRHGGRRTFTVLMVVTLVPIAGLAVFHDSLAVILALGLLLGIAGASFAVGVPMVNGWYGPERQGWALGIYGMGMGGTVVAALTAPRIADALGMTAPFLVALGLLAATALAFALLARDGRPPSAQRGSLLAPLRVFRESGRAWALTLFYFLAFGGFVAMFLYLPKLLTGVHELTKADAGARAAGFALLAVLGRPVGGWIADRIGAERVLRLSFAATVVLAAILAFTYREMVPLTICCLTLGAAFGIGTGAVFKLVAEWFPQQVGAVTGVVGAAGGLGGFFPPLVMGGVKSATGSYALGFLLLSGVAVVALAVLGTVGRPKRRDAARRRPVRATGRPSARSA